MTGSTIKLSSGHPVSDCCRDARFSRPATGLALTSTEAVSVQAGLPFHLRHSVSKLAWVCVSSEVEMPPPSSSSSAK
ncbi:unnamed protein product [Protopolystoma xenopodis]|uniref:Uncharacterized protein n=1 Tax=Protopolystoma xenopodis TaxID=117903 RepID=A0A448XPR4_9PLAT|nr:unnamed protein product [Protopolystoma xenopodis]